MKIDWAAYLTVDKNMLGNQNEPTYTNQFLYEVLACHLTLLVTVPGECYREVG